MTAMDHTPTHGARFELLLQATDSGGARYEGIVHLPAGRLVYDIQIETPGGACLLAPRGDPGTPPTPAPPWIQPYLLALGRQLYRGAEKDKSWPRRLMRWRDKSG